MVFNSFNFLYFFIVFFILYWFVTNKNLKAQNLLIILAGYIFYAWSDWRFLAYLIGASLINFYLGIYISNATILRNKKILVNLAIFQGIGGLVFFKYFNFFITSFNDSFHFLGININLSTLNIIIPLGISFFTFKILGYILDINKGKMKPTTDWINFFAYVSFFPSILSGPIDSARSFLPQLEKKRTFDYNVATDGMRQILWGLFKKVVIADNCAVYTKSIFDSFNILPASSLLLGAFFFTIQLYADFSGYSDMALGIAKLMGFRITKNFDFPFFAQNIAEFWRKWHISLTSWLTEYLFTPLSISFRDYGKWGLIAAIVLNFTICGIWHGANWTYVLYGFLHGCYFIPLILNGTMNKKKKIAKSRIFPSLKELINMLGTFTLVMFTLVIFKVNSIKDVFSFLKGLISKTITSKPILGLMQVLPLHINIVISFIIFMIIIEWFQREKDHGLQIEFIKKPLIRWSIYYSIVVSIILFGNFESHQYIYFQF